MNAARWPRANPQLQRMLVIDRSAGSFEETSVDDLPSRLISGDLVVVNDAATFPASLPVRVPSRRDHELRFTSLGRAGQWWAVLFGEGDWRMPTEARPAPDPLVPGDVLTAREGLTLIVRGTSPWSRRLLQLEPSVSDQEMLGLLYRWGRPVQYSYMESDLTFEQVQTPFAVRPVAVEMPSAARPLVWSVVDRLRLAGVELATLTHAAGLSATGDRELDARLPFPEGYTLPPSTVEAIRRTKRRGGRVLAVGTTVIRALEGNVRSHGGSLIAGPGITDLRIGPGFQPQVVDGLLSGCHEPGTSHYEVVSVFGARDLVDAAHRRAAERGYLVHEFGDSVLLMDGTITARRAA